MRNDFFEIQDIDEGVDEVSFTLVSHKDKVIRITVSADKQYTLMIKSNSTTPIFCKKGQGLWVIWEHLKSGRYKVDEIEISLYCLTRAANDFKWALAPGPNGEMLLEVPLIGVETSGAFPIPKECFSNTLGYLKLGFSVMPIEDFAINAVRNHENRTLTKEEQEKMYKCVYETQGAILLFLTHLTKLHKETETWKTT